MGRCHASLKRSSDSSSKWADSRVDSLPLCGPVPRSLPHPFLIPSDPTSLTSKPAQEEVIVSLGYGGQHVLEAVLELRGQYGFRGAPMTPPEPPIPSLDLPTLSQQSALPRDPAETGTAQLAAATWTTLPPADGAHPPLQLTTEGRVVSFSNFGGSLLPKTLIL